MRPGLEAGRGHKIMQTYADFKFDRLPCELTTAEAVWWFDCERGDLDRLREDLAPRWRGCRKLYAKSLLERYFERRPRLA